MLRISHFLHNQLTDGHEVVSLTCRPRFTPHEDILVLISVRDRVNPRVTERLEGSNKLKIFNDLIADLTRDLPAFSIVPQPTTLSRATLSIILLLLLLTTTYEPIV
jgi:hypothetical protein